MVAFYRFCARRYPIVWITLPRIGAAALGNALGVCSKDTFKAAVYRFLRFVPEVDSEVSRFWDENRSKIYDWYLKKKKSSDVIITGSPEFTVIPIARELGVRCIASKVDKRTGRLLDESNQLEVKVRHYREMFGNEPIEEFYSDSHDDDPMAAIAMRAYLVRDGKIFDWNAG